MKKKRSAQPSPSPTQDKDKLLDELYAAKNAAWQRFYDVRLPGTSRDSKVQLELEAKRAERAYKKLLRALTLRDDPDYGQGKGDDK